MGVKDEGRTRSRGGTTYYVDPARGCDDAGGSERERPWRSFAPVNGLILAPGDRVEIVAGGEFHETLAIAGAGSVDAPIEVSFAPGRYDFHPDQARARKYDISNTNDGRDIEKVMAILLDGVRHVAISGPGARIVMRGKMIELCVNGSEDVTVTGLQFDYHRPTVSEFTVVSVAPDHADLAIHEDSPFTIEDKRIVWQGEGWSYGNGEGVIAQELDLGEDAVWRRRNPLRGLEAEALSPGLLRVRGGHDMAEGRVYQLRNPFRDCVGVFLRRSRDVTFRDVDFLFMHGMGVLCQLTENITLDSVRIAPDEKSGRTCAAWADCMHFSGCRGRIVARDCVFSGAHDDAINVHGTYLRVVEVVSPNQIKVRFMHRQTFGFMAFNPGDEIDFVRWDTLDVLGSNRVVDAKLLNSREMLLTLERSAPRGGRENDVIENVTWTPEVEITGCTVSRIPTRGFLVSTRRRAVVSGNVFNRTWMSGVLVACDAESWFESGCVRDLTISKNRFDRCRKPAVLIKPANSEPNDAVHRNIRIAENEFVLAEDVAVDAYSTTGLTVEGNTVLSASPTDAGGAIRTRGCSDVRVEGNSFSTKGA